jgi:hypothetical protein
LVRFAQQLANPAKQMDAVEPISRGALSVFDQSRVSFHEGNADRR